MKNWSKVIGLFASACILWFSPLDVLQVHAEEETYDALIMDEVDEISDENCYTPENTFKYQVSGSSTYWGDFASTYYYSQLNSNQKTLYNAWYAECMNYLLKADSIASYTSDYTDRDGNVTTYTMMPAVSYSGLSQTQLYETALIFVNSNPQFYYVSGSYVTFSNDGNSGSVSFNIYPDFVDGTARQTATNAIYAKVNSWMTQIESQTSTVAKERMAHDLIINNTVYEDAEDANYDQSAASVFLKGQSVCAGYAEAFEFLMNGADIDTIIVTSSAHEWNEIKINGTWYAVDVTWDDTDTSEVSYQYFNVSDNTLKSEDAYAYDMHTPSSDLPNWAAYNRPVCSYDYGYVYDNVDYSGVFDPGYYADTYPDLKNAFGYNEELLLQHFVNYGMSEGRQARSTFNVYSYMMQYADLRRAFGTNLKQYYLHYLNDGSREGRAGTGCSTMQGALTVYKGVDYSSIYDFNTYIGNYSDLRSAFCFDDYGALEHFVSCGMSEGRQAKSTFNVYSYLMQYSDLRRAFRNDLKQYYLHYVICGKKEGRTGTGCSTMQGVLTVYQGVDYSAVYDFNTYIGNYSDLRNAFAYDDYGALEHFVSCGMSEGRQAKAAFNVYSYLMQYADLRRAFGTNFKQYYLHYLTYGSKEGRVGTGCSTMQGTLTVYQGVDYSSVYDFNTYIGNYSDLRSAFCFDDYGALQHFVNYGMSEGRQAKSDFNVIVYRNRYADLQSAFGTDLKLYFLHYIRYGKAEGRTAV